MLGRNDENVLVIQYTTTHAYFVSYSEGEIKALHDHSEPNNVINIYVPRSLLRIGAATMNYFDSRPSERHPCTKNIYFTIIQLSVLRMCRS